MVTAGSVSGPEVSYTDRFGSPAPSLNMISRSGTRTSGASSGVTKILRDDGSGPVVTAGFSSAVAMGLFMVLLPSGDQVLSAQISKKAKQRSEHDPARGGDQSEIRLVQHGVAGLHDKQRSKQAQRAADHVEPAEDGDQHAPVRGPDVVRQHDREAGRHDQETAEKHQRPACHEFLGHLAESARV